MEANAIMLITLSVAPEKEGEFNEFYHHRFLPGLLAAAPEITTIRRYEELNISGSLRWYNKQYLTVYEFKDVQSVEKSDEVFQRESVKDLVTEFQNWKTNDLKHFSRISYVPGWEHARMPVDGRFGRRPFLLWSHELKAELDGQFQEWYEQKYLPLQIADIPGWCACRRYVSVNREPLRRITVFEAPDEQALDQCLKDVRAVHRVKQNREWKRRLEPAVNWHEATSFRCIYQLPG